MKTFRFTRVVESCGQPEPHTFWTAPEQDADFQRALKTSRVMTVHQETVGSKKDFGTIGYDQSAPGEVLIFPKPLKAFANARIIGVNYALLDVQASNTPAKAAEPAKTAAKKPAPKPTPKPEVAAAEAPPFHIVRAREPRPKQPAKAPASTPPPKTAKTAKAAKPAPAPDRAEEFAALRREVQSAMKALEEGKAVAAYQKLERALRAASGD